jgi:hypothetical protein
MKEKLSPDEARRLLKEYIAAQRGVEPGTSQVNRKKRYNRRVRLGSEANELIKFETSEEGLVYPVLARLVSLLGRKGITTRRQLVKTDIKNGLWTRGCGPKTRYIVHLMQVICAGDTDDENNQG